MTPQKKNWREQDCQEDLQIPYEKNEENKSIIASKTVDVSETLEPDTSK